MLWTLLFLILSSCVLNNTSNKSTQGTQPNSTITLEKVGTFKQAPTIAYYNLTVSALDMDNILDSGSYTGPFPLPIIPPGEKRRIEIQLKDSLKQIQYTCIKSEVDFKPGDDLQLLVTCFPEFSEAWIYLPLNYAPWEGIDSGKLELISPTHDTLTDTLIIDKLLGKLSISSIPGNIKYLVSLRLWKKGSLVYKTDDSTFIYFKKGLSENLFLKLYPQYSQGQLELMLNSSPKNQIQLITSKSKLRPPEPYELLITEFYPEPSINDGESEGEWIEVSNPTSDTLDLTYIALVKTRGSTSPTTRQELADIQKILPYQSIVLGREQVSFRNYPLSLSLVNTRQSILLIKKIDAVTVLLDSLVYSATSATSDSLLSIPGKTLVRDANSFGDINQFGFWCQSEAPESPVSTPGSLYATCLD